MTHKIRILLADDHETVREGLKAILSHERDLEIVGQAIDGQDVLRRAIELVPDMVIMDISMAGASGLEATAALKARYPRIKIIALTRHRDEALAHEMLRAGASGYVLKQSRAETLLQAVRSVVAGGTYLDPGIARLLVEQARRQGPETGPVPLSQREEEVIRAVAWGYSNKEIAAKLNLSVKTVEAHKANALLKLGLHGRVDVVRLALLKGWLSEG